MESGFRAYVHDISKEHEQQSDTSWQFLCVLSLLLLVQRQDYTPNTGTEKTMDFKLNVCHTVLQKDLDVKNPDDIAAWGKKIKGTSLGYVAFFFFLRRVYEIELCFSTCNKTRLFPAAERQFSFGGLFS